jgi:hypothetical protein
VTPALVVTATLALACAGPRTGPAAEPADAVTRVFDMGREPDAGERRLDDLFAAPPAGTARGGLHDVLDALARVDAPRVLAIAPIDGEDRVAVDVEGRPDGGGTATYAVHLVRVDGAWKVEWIGGPSLAWPARPGDARGPGLSSSHDAPVGLGR